jgi:hypothetical protein
MKQKVGLGNAPRGARADRHIASEFEAFSFEALRRYFGEWGMVRNFLASACPLTAEMSSFAKDKIMTVS